MKRKLNINKEKPSPKPFKKQKDVTKKKQSFEPEVIIIDPIRRYDD